MAHKRLVVKFGYLGGNNRIGLGISNTGISAQLIGCLVCCYETSTDSSNEGGEISIDLFLILKVVCTSTLARGIDNCNGTQKTSDSVLKQLLAVDLHDKRKIQLADGAVAQ